MSKHTQSAAAQPGFSMPDIEQLSRLYTGGTESWLQSGNAMMKAMSELNAEILGFTRQRLDAGVAVSQSLAKCKSVQSAFEIQLDFARTEAQIYLDQARKMLDMATQAASEGIKPLREHGINGNGEARTHAKAKE